MQPTWLALNHAIEVWKPSKTTTVSVDLSAVAGYGSARHNNFNYGADRKAFTDVTVSLGVPIHMGGNWTLTPSVNYASLLDSRIRHATGPDNHSWVGLALSCSF